MESTSVQAILSFVAGNGPVSLTMPPHRRDVVISTKHWLLANRKLPFPQQESHQKAHLQPTLVFAGVLRPGTTILPHPAAITDIPYPHFFIYHLSLPPLPRLSFSFSSHTYSSFVLNPLTSEVSFNEHNFHLTFDRILTQSINLQDAFRR